MLDTREDRAHCLGDVQFMVEHSWEVGERKIRLVQPVERQPGVGAVESTPRDELAALVPGLMNRHRRGMPKRLLGVVSRRSTERRRTHGGRSRPVTGARSGQCCGGSGQAG